jgi:hypothetical protein
VPRIEAVQGHHLIRRLCGTKQDFVIVQAQIVA